MGIGWNLDHLVTSKSGGLEEFEARQAAALKQARPDIGVMVLRNTEVVSTALPCNRSALPCKYSALPCKILRPPL